MSRPGSGSAPRPLPALFLLRSHWSLAPGEAQKPRSEQEGRWGSCRDQDPARSAHEEPRVRMGPAGTQGGADTPDPLVLPARGHRAGGGPWELWGDLQTQPAPARLSKPAPRPASTRETGGATSASPARARRTWQRWRPPPTWACPGAGRSESMMPRCAWGAAAIQVRGWSKRPGGGRAGRGLGRLVGRGGAPRAPPWGRVTPATWVPCARAHP